MFDKEDVLRLTTEIDIFKLFFDDIQLDKHRLYIAPYREDSIPKCYFEYGYTGVLHFVDFASSVVRKDCFGLVMAVYKVSFQEALFIIDKLLSLGLSNADTIIPPVPAKSIAKTPEEIRKQTELQVRYREFNLRDRDFWYSYGITRSQLISDKVYPVSSYTLYTKDGKVINSSPYQVTYVFEDFPNNRKKIYSPKSNTFKWVTNCTGNDIGGVDNLDYTKDYVIISKSYKDYRVLKNEGLNTVWFQNEGMLPSKEVIEKYLKGFKKIIIFFDNDKAGLEACIKVKEYLTKILGSEILSFIVPIPYLKDNVKDPSDLRKFNNLQFNTIINKLKLKL